MIVTENQKVPCNKCKQVEVVIDYTEQLESDPPQCKGKCQNCGEISYWRVEEQL